MPPKKRARVEAAPGTLGHDDCARSSTRETPTNKAEASKRGGVSVGATTPAAESGATFATPKNRKRQAVNLSESSAAGGEKGSIKAESDGRLPKKVSASSEKTHITDATKGAAQDTVKVPETPGVGSRHVLPSGLEFEVLKLGKGTTAAARGKTVEVKYEGRLAKTGKRFDKGTIKFRLGAGEVIKGWDDGVKGMLAGERRRLLVPARLGYGSRGAPPDIPPNAALVFEVEFLR
jgi:FK506-binding nuclear protein